MKETNISMKLHSLHCSHFVKTKHKASEAEAFQRYVFWGKNTFQWRKDYMWVKHHTYEAPDNERENKHQLVEYTSLFPCAGKGKSIVYEGRASLSKGSVAFMQLWVSRKTVQNYPGCSWKRAGMRRILPPADRGRD